MRNRNLLRALQREGVRVCFLAFAEPEELHASHDQLLSLCEHVQFAQAPKRYGQFEEYLGRFASLFRTTPYGPRRFRSELMTAALHKALDTHRFQAIICDDVYLACNLPANLSVPIFLNKHDLTYEILARYLETERNWAKKIYGRLEYRKIRRMELRECKRAKVVLACSARDKQLIQSHCPEANVCILPNVVDTDDYSPVPDQQNNLILFVGSLDWLPNRDAVEYFITQVFPDLRQMHPEVRFAVAGRLPPPWFRERLGRMKILEAAAMAKPTVSTRLGAEGLDFVEGQEILLEDEPSKFARAVSGLLKDPSRRREIGRAARLRVEKQYGVAALRDAWRQVLCAAEKIGR
jgi:glycosyltransferase involved in cell wall biosynthesis